MQKPVQIPPANMPQPKGGNAQSACLRLTELMDGLEAIVVEETALVRAGKLGVPPCSAPRKTDSVHPLFQDGADEIWAQRLNRRRGAAG